MPPPLFSSIAYPSLGIHRGAIDQTMITTRPPPEAMRRIRTALDQMGIAVEVESEWRYRCIRPRRADDELGDKEQVFEDAVVDTSETTPPDPESMEQMDAPKVNDVFLDNSTKTGTDDSAVTLSRPQAAYGPPAEDPGGEVRFSVELTHLDRLEGTFSLDIRRLKGNLRSYKFIYDSLRSSTDLQN